MYIPKRWLASSILGTMLLVAIVALTVSGVPAEQLRSRSAEPAEAELAASTSPALDRFDADCPLTPEQAAVNKFLAALPPAPTVGIPQPVPGPTIDGHRETIGNFSPNSQFSAGSWGDIGQQWRDVQVNAPVVNNHVSNEGNHNTNNLVTGNNNNVNSGPINVNINVPTAPQNAAAAPAATVPVTTTPVTTAPATTVAPPTTVAAGSVPPAKP